RIAMVPGAGESEFEVSAGPLGRAGPPPGLAPVVVPGGIGRHKWSDRTLLDALEAEFAPALPLLVALDGFLLDTTRPHPFLRLDAPLSAPPLDGRILPGVTRAEILRTHDASESPLHIDDLANAAAVYVTSALRGLQEVRA